MAKGHLYFDRPTAEQLEAELSRIKDKEKTKEKKKLNILCILSAIAVLLIVLFCLFPVAVADGHILVLSKYSSPSSGDMAVIEYGNRNILRRVIAVGGDEVDIDANGEIYINKEKSKEYYIAKNRDAGVDIELPCRVPEGEYFAISEDENSFPDSRNTKLGTVEKEIIRGKVIFTVK